MQIRSAITEFFKERDCYTLVRSFIYFHIKINYFIIFFNNFIVFFIFRPVNDEKQLRVIDNIPYEKLRPVFREKLEIFISNVFTNISPKIINNVPIKGQNFVDLIINYSDALNNHAFPDIAATWVSSFFNLF